MAGWRLEFGGQGGDTPERRAIQVPEKWYPAESFDIRGRHVASVASEVVGRSTSIVQDVGRG